jgi:hypothetical protein
MRLIGTILLGIYSFDNEKVYLALGGLWRRKSFKKIVLLYSALWSMARIKLTSKAYVVNIFLHLCIQWSLWRPVSW